PPASCWFISPQPTRSRLFPYTTLFRSRLFSPRGRPMATERETPRPSFHGRAARQGAAGKCRHPSEARRKLLTTVLTPRHYDSPLDRKSTRLNSSHVKISYAVFCLKKKT